MALKTTVILSSNGKYWQAFYYDLTGKRRARSLGPKSKLSKRQAKILCDRLAAELILKPTIAGGLQMPKLHAFLDRYLETRTDIRKTTRALYETTITYLKDYFADIRLDHISRHMAVNFRTYLAKKKVNNNPISEQTVRKHLRNCKTIFCSAVNEDVLMFSPFDRLKSAPLQPDKDWYYLCLEEFEKLLNNCPNMSWKVFLGLCRLAGLRQSEAYHLTWHRIDWVGHRITVLATKTNKKRIVPIEPRLCELLLCAYESAPDGVERVCYNTKFNNLRRTFHGICERAGLKPWNKWCHTLRKNAETDWSQRFPQYVVSYWLGHSLEVSERHYLQVPEELYEKIASSAPVPPRIPSVR